jgi:hypothetical protein
MGRKAKHIPQEVLEPLLEKVRTGEVLLKDVQRELSDAGYEVSIGWLHTQIGRKEQPEKGALIPYAEFQRTIEQMLQLSFRLGQTETELRYKDELLKQKDELLREMNEEIERLKTELESAKAKKADEAEEVKRRWWHFWRW